jgi:hypothetical protein
VCDMAGNYMDAPSDRVAWDRDGSLLTSISQYGVLSNRSAVEKQAINAESDTATTIACVSSQIVFSVPTDVVAMFLSLSYSLTETITVYYSTDTTNGLDGSWTSTGESFTAASVVRATKPFYRESASLVTFASPLSAIRGLRLTMDVAGSFYFRSWHVYGTPASSATTDRLAIWHPTSDAKASASWFDWGDAPQSSSADKTFRVKNLSSTYTANDIDIYIQALTPGSPSIAGMHTLSDDTVTFQPTLNVSSLSPGEISSVFTIRRVIPSDAQISVWSARLAADVNEWTV